jgi:hypothetical protein
VGVKCSSKRGWRASQRLMAGCLWVEFVQNDVNVLAQRNFAVDLFKKFQSLAVGGCPGGVSDDFALQIVQGGKEGDRPVAIVIVGLGADMPFTQGQTRLAALKSLDLAFLITTKHNRPLGRNGSS